VTQRAPPVRFAMAVGTPPTVVVVTGNSLPTLVPVASNTCALIDRGLASPSKPLLSLHVTTKPPLLKPVMVGKFCWFSVVVFDEELAADLATGGIEHLRLDRTDGAVAAQPYRERSKPN
jgi:hypothetical protein